MMIGDFHSRRYFISRYSKQFPHHNQGKRARFSIASSIVLLIMACWKVGTFSSLGLADSNILVLYVTLEHIWVLT